MQPMTAMDTPGRWPVLAAISAVTVCRSKSVRPQEGQETNSVLTLRMREPWRSAKERGRSSARVTTLEEIITPSPRPSTSREPSCMPTSMVRWSWSGTSLKSPTRMMGWSEPLRTSISKTRRDACTREVPGAASRRTITASTSLALRSASSDSVPSMRRARRRAPSGSLGVSKPAAAMSARFMMATAPGTGAASRALASAMTPIPAVCRRRSTTRESSSSTGGTSSRTTESMVAISLKGKPTAILAPMSA
mmetsp:Transcript_8928/g.25948  ORF Transcript_8928/g.25948 Transcript_8928/m.25948 type:complete len:250 (-) Transcript_8928:1203-1952(-)